MPTRPYLYDGFVERLSDQFETALSEIDAVYNFDIGPEFEIAICKVLQLVVPERYAVCRGFVVNKNGDKAGDDIIIYDRSVFPTIRLLGRDQLTQKEGIPVEAVAGYIEAKHTISIEGKKRGSLAHTVKQLSGVKQLINGRPKMPLNHMNRYCTLSGLEFKRPKGTGIPEYGNLFLTMIISRNVRLRANRPAITDPSTISESFRPVKITQTYPPDVVVIGAHNLILPSVLNDEGEAETRIFAENESPEYMAITMPDTAFGVALSLLMLILDSTQLGPLPWMGIVNNAVELRRQDRTSNT